MNSISPLPDSGALNDPTSLNTCPLAVNIQFLWTVRLFYDYYRRENRLMYLFSDSAGCTWSIASKETCFGNGCTPKATTPSDSDECIWSRCGFGYPCRSATCETRTEISRVGFLESRSSSYGFEYRIHGDWLYFFRPKIIILIITRNHLSMRNSEVAK